MDENDTLYPDFYYDQIPRNINETVDSVIRDYGTVTTFFRGSSVLLLRAGFLLIQVGCIPVTDVHTILLQNIIDVACSTIAYGMVGYILSFGHDAAGVIGYGNWIMSDEADMDSVVLGWSAVVTSAAIFTTVVAGRMHCVAYFIITTVNSGLLQPIILHWVWAKAGFMHKAMLSSHYVSYRDYGGGMVIHVFGGTFALFGAIFLGRRLILLRDLDEASLPPESPATAVVGYILLIIGFMGICLPSPLYEKTHIPGNYIGNTVVCNAMAAAGGMITVVILQFFVSRDILDHWIILRYMQGAIAGIVTIAPGVDVYKPLVAFGVSIPGAIIFYIFVHQLHVTAIEDYANIIPIHIVCGLFGTFLPPLCAPDDIYRAIHIHLAWQLICDVSLYALIIIVSVTLFFSIKCSGFLRNSIDEQSHRRAKAVQKRGPPRPFMGRLFTPIKEQQYLQPGYVSKKKINLTSTPGTGDDNSDHMHNSPTNIWDNKSEYESNKNNTTQLVTENESSKTPLSSSLTYPETKSKKPNSSKNTTEEEEETQPSYQRKLKRNIYTVSTCMRNISANETVKNIQYEMEGIMKGITANYDSDDVDEEVCFYTSQAQEYSDLYQGCNSKSPQVNFARAPTPYVSNRKSNFRKPTPYRLSKLSTTAKCKSNHLPTAKKKSLFKHGKTKLFNSNKNAKSLSDKTDPHSTQLKDDGFIGMKDPERSSNNYNNSSVSVSHISDVEITLKNKEIKQFQNKTTDDRILSPTEYFADFSRCYFNINDSLV